MQLCDFKLINVTQTSVQCVVQICREFAKHLDSIADQVVKDTNAALESVKIVKLDENRQKLLRTQIKEAVNREHPVNKLISEFSPSPFLLASLRLFKELLCPALSIDYTELK